MATRTVLGMWKTECHNAHMDLGLGFTKSTVLHDILTTVLCKQLNIHPNEVDDSAASVLVLSLLCSHKWTPYSIYLCPTFARSYLNQDFMNCATRRGRAYGRGHDVHRCANKPYLRMHMRQSGPSLVSQLLRLLLSHFAHTLHVLCAVI